MTSLLYIKFYLSYVGVYLCRVSRWRSGSFPVVRRSGSFPVVRRGELLAVRRSSTRRAPLNIAGMFDKRRYFKTFHSVQMFTFFEVWGIFISHTGIVSILSYFNNVKISLFKVMWFFLFDYNKVKICFV